ncbi:MAG TPA: FxsA family protein [Cellvibrionaceae bacterium]|nr:FxsA family protein [Cellvibrionaceae bacterium]HMW70993.1 FxsA family protein [Cellvibrionaceae bacterium]
MRKIIGIWLGLELVLAWLISHWVGFGSLLLSWLFAIAVGAYLLRGLGEHVRTLRQGAPSLALSGPLARVGAAILFIIPGTLTDILALLLLIPATQSRVSRRWGDSGFSGGFSPRPSQGGGDIIEGEWVEENRQNPRIGPHQ